MSAKKDPTIIDWEVIEDIPESEAVPPCPTGAFNHEWSFTLHEGKMILTSGCEQCDEEIVYPVGGEDFFMEDFKIICKVDSHLETYGYETPEYDHWWNVTPTKIVSLAKEELVDNCRNPDSCNCGVKF